MHKILVVGGARLIAESIDTTMSEPCRASEVNEIIRRCEPMDLSSVDYRPDRSWRGGSRKKGGKTKYLRK